mmetsp:Transcript_24501/g.30795  ORF Transcript_24501/g.30795 Transcript_24501/m.30795 type:complete len:291 (+) Transcript_24501:134-1006(+)
MSEPTRKKTAAEMLEEYKAKQQVGHTTRDEKKLELQRLLASRSAHLPGYSWCADWVQWMRNNHPVFGMCCKYKENPVGIGQRVMILISSIFFGLAATNLVYLFYHIVEEANGVVFEIQTGDGDGKFVLTYEQVAVWTFGSILHSLTDLGIWHLTACACCMPGACCGCCGWLRTLGRFATIAVCGSIVALGTTALIMRANFEASDGQAEFNELTGLELEIRSFSFLTAYFVELVLVWFCYYPIMATIFFSGAVRPILPCIGGRPKEIDRQREEKRKKMKNGEEDFDDNPYV